MKKIQTKTYGLLEVTCHFPDLSNFLWEYAESNLPSSLGYMIEHALLAQHTIVFDHKLDVTFLGNSLGGLFGLIVDATPDSVKVAAARMRGEFSKIPYRTWGPEMHHGAEPLYGIPRQGIQMPDALRDLIMGSTLDGFDSIPGARFRFSQSQWNSWDEPSLADRHYRSTARELVDLMGIRAQCCGDPGCKVEQYILEEKRKKGLFTRLDPADFEMVKAFIISQNHAQIQAISQLPGMKLGKILYWPIQFVGDVGAFYISLFKGFWKWLTVKLPHWWRYRVWFAALSWITISFVIGLNFILFVAFPDENYKPCHRCPVNGCYKIKANRFGLRLYKSTDWIRRFIGAVSHSLGKLRGLLLKLKLVKAKNPPVEK